MSNPSSLTFSGRAVPLALHSIGKISSEVRNSSVVVLAGILPGQRTMHGTRMPPSNIWPLAPRKGLLLAAPPPPLSLKKMTRVLSAILYLSSKSSNLPMAASMAVIEPTNSKRRAARLGTVKVLP